MKLNEFLTTYVYALIQGSVQVNYSTRILSFQEMESKYDNWKFFFHLPRIQCKDGFSISIQVNNGNYCSTENGYRKYGKEWVSAEWGYPSESIDANRYNAEEADDTTETVGCCEVEILDELLEQHGGIDLKKTLFNT